MVIEINERSASGDLHDGGVGNLEIGRRDFVSPPGMSLSAFYFGLMSPSGPYFPPGSHGLEIFFAESSAPESPKPDHSGLGDHHESELAFRRERMWFEKNK